MDGSIVALRGCLRKALAKFDDDRSITTDAYKGCQSESSPCTSKCFFYAAVFGLSVFRWYRKVVCTSSIVSTRFERHTSQCCCVYVYDTWFTIMTLNEVGLDENGMDEQGWIMGPFHRDDVVLAPSLQYLYPHISGHCT